MYIEALRSSWKMAVAITIGVAAASALVTSGFNGWRSLPVEFMYQTLVSACVGMLFWLGMPVLNSRAKRLTPARRWAVRIIVAAAILNIGVTIGLALLVGVGRLPSSAWAAAVRDSAVPTTVFGVSCFVGIMMYEGLKYRSQYETASARLSSLESRLHPHFLFNTLNSILALIPDDPPAAERMTQRLAALLRYSLDANPRSTVPLRQELRMATAYLEIEKTRFGERLRYTIDIPECLGQVQVPPFALQTLVENCVKHGGSEIRVSARVDGDVVHLQVWDSGQGFPAEMALPEGHGLQNLKARLDALWGRKAALSILSAESGTAVRVSLPGSSE